MSQKLYRQEASGAVCAVGPQNPYVTLPTATIDLWMPLIGAVGVGVYAMYRRLAREGRVRGSDLKRMAKAARISDNTLRSLNQILERIGFIVVEKPEGANRVRHYTTEIRLLEPPTRVPVELIRELECRSGYEILAHWLVESEEADASPQHVPVPLSADGTENLSAPPSVPTVAPQRPQAPTSAVQSAPSVALQRQQALTGVPQGAAGRVQASFSVVPNTLSGAIQRSQASKSVSPNTLERVQALTSAAPHAGEGPVALSSVIESVIKRQIALISAPLPAPERGHAPTNASGVAPQRIMEASGSATLESSGIESFRGREESPLPLFKKNLKCPEPPRLPWKDSHKGQETASPPYQPTRLSGQSFTSLHSGQGEHG